MLNKDWLCEVTLADLDFLSYPVIGVDLDSWFCSDNDLIPFCFRSSVFWSDLELLCSQFISYSLCLTPVLSLLIIVNFVLPVVLPRCGSVHRTGAGADFEFHSSMCRDRSGCRCSTVIEIPFQISMQLCGPVQD